MRGNTAAVITMVTWADTPLTGLTTGTAGASSGGNGYSRHHNPDLQSHSCKLHGDLHCSGMVNFAPGFSPDTEVRIRQDLLTSYVVIAAG